MLKLELATKAFTATKLEKNQTRKKQGKKQGKKKKKKKNTEKKQKQPTSCLHLSTSDKNLRYFPFKDADKI